MSNYTTYYASASHIHTSHPSHTHTHPTGENILKQNTRLLQFDFFKVLFNTQNTVMFDMKYINIVQYLSIKACINYAFVDIDIHCNREKVNFNMCTYIFVLPCIIKQPVDMIITLNSHYYMLLFYTLVHNRSKPGIFYHMGTLWICSFNTASCY